MFPFPATFFIFDVFVQLTVKKFNKKLPIPVFEPVQLIKFIIGIILCNTILSQKSYEINFRKRLNKIGNFFHPFLVLFWGHEP